MQKEFAFQSRALRLEDDGLDFERFVFECFRIAKEEIGFARRLARGRDGAIDLIDRFGSATGVIVAECKFIGSGSAAEALARWREVARNLKRNLRQIRAEPSKYRNSPYRNWLDEDHPVTEYRFCVTSTMSDLEVTTRRSLT